MKCVNHEYCFCGQSVQGQLVCQHFTQTSIEKTCQLTYVQRRKAINEMVQGRVVQSIVKCFMTLLPNALIFFVEKLKKAFALQKLLTFFSAKNIGIFQILTFEILTER